MSNFSLFFGSTLAAAAVAGIIAYRLARWQLSRAASAAKGSARILYLEIIYNLSMLNEGLKVGSNQPWFNDQAWQAHQATVASLTAATFSGRTCLEPAPGKRASRCGSSASTRH